MQNYRAEVTHVDGRSNPIENQNSKKKILYQSRGERSNNEPNTPNLQAYYIHTASRLHLLSQLVMEITKER